MSPTDLIRLGGLAAALAGLLRVIASFIPATKPGPALEVFYLMIDVLLLLGLLGVYGYQHEQVGAGGFLGFLAALVGTAIIVGPDGAIGGVEMYVVGSLLISLGLAVLGIGTWRARRLPRAVPALWWLSTLVGVGGFAAGELRFTYLFAGVAFGLAFALAGARIWSDPRGKASGLDSA
jgi:hypothetical protein